MYLAYIGFGFIRDVSTLIRQLKLPFFTIIFSEIWETAKELDLNTMVIPFILFFFLLNEIMMIKEKVRFSAGAGQLRR